MRRLICLGLALLGVPTGAAPAMAAGADLAPLLSRQIARCWNPPPGTSGSVTVRFDLTQDGHVAGAPRVLGLASVGVAKAAQHAITFCQPYKLPPERFSDWQHAV
ncbi:MAG: hypothetical protein ACTHOR_20010, partial [Devosia sp.]